MFENHKLQLVQERDKYYVRLLINNMVVHYYGAGFFRNKNLDLVFDTPKWVRENCSMDYKEAKTMLTKLKEWFDKRRLDECDLHMVVVEEVVV